MLPRGYVQFSLNVTLDTEVETVSADDVKYLNFIIPWLGFPYQSPTPMTLTFLTLFSLAKTI